MKCLQHLAFIFAELPDRVFVHYGFRDCNCLANSAAVCTGAWQAYWKQTYAVGLDALLSRNIGMSFSASGSAATILRAGM
jgi:hypothetical protein